MYILMNQIISIEYAYLLMLSRAWGTLLNKKSVSHVYLYYNTYTTVVYNIYNSVGYLPTQLFLSF